MFQITNEDFQLRIFSNEHKSNTFRKLRLVGAKLDTWS